MFEKFTLGRARTWRQRCGKALCEDTWNRLFPPDCSRATVDRARRNCDSSRRKPILRRNDPRWDGHGRIWYRWCCRHRSQGKDRIDIRIQDCWSVSLKNNLFFFFFLILRIHSRSKREESICLLFDIDILIRKKLVMTGVYNFYRLREKFYINRISEVKINKVLYIYFEKYIYIYNYLKKIKIQYTYIIS